MCNGNDTHKMANADDYPRIIDDNLEMTCPLHKLLIIIIMFFASKDCYWIIHT